MESGGGSNASAKMMAAMSGMDTLFSNPVPQLPSERFADWKQEALPSGLWCTTKRRTPRNSGMARNMVLPGGEMPKDIEPYMDSVFENNVLLPRRNG